jgi:hypothetical protein
MLVAAYMEKHPGSPQTIKQHLAAIQRAVVGVEAFEARDRNSVRGIPPSPQNQPAKAWVVIKLAFVRL